VSVLRSVIMAFSMFSKVPMPRIEWREESMRYLFCAFPLVGVAVGLAFWGWYALCDWMDVGDVLYAAGCVALPVLLTGGIHLDGFCDTVDALSSYADREKKLEILKDPHIGAFAMIYTVVYFAVLLGVQAELRDVPSLPWLFGTVCVLSRVVGGAATLALPNARTGGLAHTFSSGAQRVPAFAASFLWAAGSLFVAFRFGPVVPAHGLWIGLLVPSLIFPHMAKKQFGGMTGDLAGFLIQMSEMCMLLGILLAHKMGGIL